MTTYRGNQQSPLRRNNSVLSMNSNSVLGESRNRVMNRIHIEGLLQKFNELNGSIEIEADQTNFNLIEYERENDKIKYDPQMMTAKLRKLQNRAEINRAQMEIDNRLKKKLRKNQKKSEMRDDSYQTIYNKFIKNHKFSEDFDEGSDEDESNPNENKPKDLAYFSQLKRHPKLLEYTLNMINSRALSKEQSMRVKGSENQRNSNIEISEDYKELMEEMNKKNNQKQQHNPESVIQQQFSKFFNKKSSESLNTEIVSMPRCSRMIAKQNEILSHIDDKSLSKDNKKRLKNRLNEIICSIGKNQKSSQNKKQAQRKKEEEERNTSATSAPQAKNGTHFSNSNVGNGFALPKIFATTVVRNEKSLLRSNRRNK